MAKTISERLKKRFNILGIRLYYFLAKSIFFMLRSLLPVWFVQLYLIAVPIIYFYGVFFSFSRAAAGLRCFILLSRLETLTSTSTQGRGCGGGGPPALWAHGAAWLCSSSSVRVKAAHLWFNLQRGLSQITLCNSTIATNLPAPLAARSSEFLRRCTKSSTFSGC